MYIYIYIYIYHINDRTATISPKELLWEERCNKNMAECGTENNIWQDFWPLREKNPVPTLSGGRWLSAGGIPALPMRKVGSIM